MAKKVPQRDINLARKTGVLVRELLGFQDYVLDPTADSTVTRTNGKNIQHMAREVLNFYNELHFYERKATHIELKGQRG